MDPFTLFAAIAAVLFASAEQEREQSKETQRRRRVLFGERYVREYRAPADPEVAYDAYPPRPRTRAAAMPTYFRVQPIARDVADLIGTHHTSNVWHGDRDILCSVCNGAGRIAVSYESDEDCERCDGAGRVEDTRSGVSVCRSVEDLATYLSTRAPNLTGCHVVELAGDISDNTDLDATEAGSPVLIHPTAIVAVHPVTILEGRAKIPRSRMVTE